MHARTHGRFFIPTPVMKSFAELFTEADDSAQQLGEDAGGQLRLCKTSRLKDKASVFVFFSLLVLLFRASVLLSPPSAPVAHENSTTP